MDNTNQIITILEEALSKLKKTKAEQEQETTEHQQLANSINEMKTEIKKLSDAII